MGESALEIKSQELIRDRKEVGDTIESKREADRAAMRPILEKLESDIQIQKDEITRLERTKHDKQEQHQTAINEVARIKEDLDTTHVILLDQHEREFNKIKNEAPRLRKQVEKYESALHHIADTHEQVSADFTKTAQSVEILTGKRKETEELRQKATVRLQLVSESVQ